jgi:HK97 family phage major capsid protein
MKVTSIEQLPVDQRKSLSSFSLGSSGFFLPPEMSTTVLSCLEDTSDVTGLVSNTPISGPSIKFPIDNSKLDEAAWACQSNCFANSPSANFLEGLSEIKIRPESLRAITCASRDLIEDASVNMEVWLTQKVQRQFRETISNAIMMGDGVGKPLGILNPAAGVPI